MAGFIASQRDAHGVPQAVSCRALGVSQSWFYKWKQGELPPRAARREQLKAEIARLFAEREGKDGSPRITAALRDDGWRVIGEHGRGADARAGPGRPAQEAPQGDHAAGQGPLAGTRPGEAEVRRGGINRRWYGDGTEIPTGEGKLYLDSVLDMGSRRIVGFALGARHDAALAYGALAMAVAVRGGHGARGDPPHRLCRGWR